MRLTAWLLASLTACSVAPETDYRTGEAESANDEAGDDGWPTVPVDPAETMPTVDLPTSNPPDGEPPAAGCIDAKTPMCWLWCDTQVDAGCLTVAEAVSQCDQMYLSNLGCWTEVEGKLLCEASSLTSSCTAPSCADESETLVACSAAPCAGIPDASCQAACVAGVQSGCTSTPGAPMCEHYEATGCIAELAAWTACYAVSIDSSCTAVCGPEWAAFQACVVAGL